MFRRALGIGIVIGLLLAVVATAYVLVESMIDADATMQDEVSAARTAWLLIAPGVAAVVVVAGWAADGELFGAFIDSRNRYSLSRLQVAAWTALVLSSLAGGSAQPGHISHTAIAVRRPPCNPATPRGRLLPESCSGKRLRIDQAPAAASATAIFAARIRDGGRAGQDRIAGRGSAEPTEIRGSRKDFDWRDPQKSLGGATVAAGG